LGENIKVLASVLTCDRKANWQTLQEPVQKLAFLSVSLISSENDKYKTFHTVVLVKFYKTDPELYLRASMTIKEKLYSIGPWTKSRATAAARQIRG